MLCRMLRRMIDPDCVIYDTGDVTCERRRQLVPDDTVFDLNVKDRLVVQCSTVRRLSTALRIEVTFL